jgi:hypothetical protein
MKTFIFTKGLVYTKAAKNLTENFKEAINDDKTHSLSCSGGTALLGAVRRMPIHLSVV